MVVDPRETFPGDLSSPRRHEQGVPDVFGLIPRLSRRLVRLEERLARLQGDLGTSVPFRWLSDALGTFLEIGRPELLGRASGLRRPALVAQFSWPGAKTRLAAGVEVPLAHAIVDRLLGYDRDEAEGRLQLTPVEWGVMTFVVARSLDALAQRSGSLVPDDLIIDRVGPDPFLPGDLGSILTLRWPSRIGAVAGSIRLWIPESPLTQWMNATPLRAEPGPPTLPRYHALEGVWRAEAGTITLPRGAARLRVGGVLPIDGSPLRGSPETPLGALRLALGLPSIGSVRWLSAEAVPLSWGSRLIATSTLQSEPIPSEAHAVSNPADSFPEPDDSGAPPSPAEIPVTLTVELGRINLTLGRLADLRPGDVLELSRHSREPVELTSGGRLIARGELVQIDTELGVRVTHVFL